MNTIQPVKPLNNKPHSILNQISHPKFTYQYQTVAHIITENDSTSMRNAE